MSGNRPQQLIRYCCVRYSGQRARNLLYLTKLGRAGRTRDQMLCDGPGPPVGDKALEVLLQQRFGICAIHIVNSLQLSYNLTYSLTAAEEHGLHGPERHVKSFGYFIEFEAFDMTQHQHHALLLR